MVAAQRSSLVPSRLFAYTQWVRRLQETVARVWAAPATALGLVCIVAGCRGASVRRVDGVIEASGPAIAWGLRHLTLLKGGASALTLGHVVLARDADTLDWTRAHERVHVRQYERWGILFVPAYVLASFWAAMRGRHFYFDNPFEAEAYALENHPASGAAAMTDLHLQPVRMEVRRDTTPAEMI